MANLPQIDWTKYAVQGQAAYFGRANDIPLDGTSIYYTLADAEAYASESKIVYAGQQLAVVDTTNNKVDYYKVLTDRTLEKVGVSQLSSEYQKAASYTDPAAGDSLETAISKLHKGIENATSGGVQSVGGQAGAITLRGELTGSGDVNLTMNGKEIEASIVGLKSAAFVETSTFDASGSAALAESASKAYAKPAVDYVSTNSGSLDSVKVKVTDSSASWDSAATWVGSNSASYNSASWDSAATWVGSHSASLEVVEASASAWNSRLDKVEATASANSASIAALETASGSFMKKDGSNSNIKYQLNFNDSASAIKFDTVANEFQFIF